MKLGFFVLISLFVFTGFLSAHGSSLPDISLDFDEDYKALVDEAAKDFLNETREPFKYNLLLNRIQVFFDQEDYNSLDNFVFIDSRDFSVLGFYNSSLLKNKGEGFDEGVLKAKAEEMVVLFVKEDFQDELVFNRVTSDFRGATVFEWIRKVEGIVVMGEDVTVSMNPSTSEVVGVSVPMFDEKSERIDTKPEISFETAKQIVFDKVSDSSVSDKFEPTLVIAGEQLIWLFLMDSEVDLIKTKFVDQNYVQVDANTGELLKLGKDFDEGTTFPVGDHAKFVEVSKPGSFVDVILAVLLVVLLVLGLNIIRK